MEHLKCANFKRRRTGKFNMTTPPKSACIGCLYHSAAAWATMKAEDPASWHDAVGVDWALRNVVAAKSAIDGDATYTAPARRFLKSTSATPPQTQTQR